MDVGKETLWNHLAWARVPGYLGVLPEKMKQRSLAGGFIGNPLYERSSMRLLLVILGLLAIVASSGCSDGGGRSGGSDGHSGHQH